MISARRWMSSCILVSSLIVPVHGVTAEQKASDTDASTQWRRWMPENYATQLRGKGLPAPQRWWTEFRNPELDELVAIAFANNADLKAAVARLTQAEARARIAKAGQSPTIDALVRAERRAPEFGVGTAPVREDFRSRKIYQAGLRTAYEVDLWGKGSYQQAAALSQIEASVFAREALALSLVADVTTGYFEVLALRERLAIAQQDVARAREIEDIVKRRLERGDLSLFELEQQGITTNEAAARQFELEQDLGRAESELAFLIGRPRSMLELNGQSLQGVAVPLIEPGLPSALVCRRPDVRQAEAELAGARANVGVARKALLPSFSLTAEGGLGSSNLSAALAPQSIFTDLVGQVVQSVFDGGRRKGQIAESKAFEQELLQRYQSRILGALRDVDEALSGVRFTSERLDTLEGSAVRATRMLTLSQRVFERGAIDYATLLDSQRLQYRLQLQAIDARYDHLRASIDLYKALGGGVTIGKDTCVSSLAAQAPAIDEEPTVLETETQNSEPPALSSPDNAAPTPAKKPPAPKKKSRRF